MILTRVGAGLIAVDARGQRAAAAAVDSLGPAWTAVVLACALAAAVRWRWLAASRSLRERLPRRPEVDLR